MKIAVKNIKEILDKVPTERKEVFTKLHQTILSNLPKGFEAAISYGGLGYVVSHTIYPSGYHCKPTEPLPFAGIASQKNSINFYHMGIYADASLMEWFVSEYSKHCHQKLDMGKSCIRFKKINEIPFELIGKLMQKISVEQWIKIYESKFIKHSVSKKLVKL